MRIDAHQHFWNYDPEEHGWIDDTMSILKRDFLPPELEKISQERNIGGTVCVQARQSVAETEWLLSLAEKHPLIKGVVGWLPLASPRAGEEIEKHAGNEKLKGLRHVIQDEPDPEFMRSPDFNRGLSLLKNFGLAFDLLVREWQLPMTIRLADAHPGQVFVLDHAAKPPIRSGGTTEPWRRNIRELARRGNVFCKVSGMVTEADWKKWTVENLRPCFETVLESFGTDRLIFGSDWPVCELARGHGEWLDAFETLASGLSSDEKKKVFEKNARKAYKL